MTEFQILGTFAVASLAAVIAFGQWWTARKKLALDLFEKRFSVFMDVRRLASEAFQLNGFTNKGEADELLARARFLFGDDVNNALKDFHRISGKVEIKDPSAGGDLVMAYEKMIPLFERYLSLTDKPPRWPF